MNWQKIANIAGPRGADGVDGETPDIEWQGTALSVNGEVGPDLRGPQGTPGDPGKDSTVPGPPGERGAPGPAPAIKIGTVSSGTTPSATITGTSPDLTLGLVLPKGDRGDRGETGAPGVVSSASSYVIVGPGRPDVPSTTAGTITGAEPVGAEFRSQDGAGVGAFVWMKRPGGAWEVTVGDTGWRKPTLASTITGGNVLIKRSGNRISVFGRMVTGTTGWLFADAAIAGFQSSITTGIGGAQAVQVSESVATGGMIRIASRRLPYLTFSGSATVDFSYDYWTADSWPSTLPGTPA